MIKKEGRTHSAVAEELQLSGEEIDQLEIATLSRGTSHLVILRGETIGEYNHKSKKLALYPTE